MNFVRVVAPDDVLKRYAEILNLRLPMKKVRKSGIDDIVSVLDVPDHNEIHLSLNTFQSVEVKSCLCFFNY